MVYRKSVVKRFDCSCDVGVVAGLGEVGCKWG